MMDSASTKSRSLLFALVTLLILGSLLPERAKHAIGTQGYWHRPLHIVLFIATTVTASAAFPRRLLITTILLMALACSLELAEHLVYRNPFEWHDLRDDVIGVLAGTALFSTRKQS